jgi:hypothetical protein
MGADAGRLDFTAPVLVADHIERCASSEPTSGRLLADSASEHCVIRGTPLNFRSQSTSCPIEADAGTGEFDPIRTFEPQFGFIVHITPILSIGSPNRSGG